MTRIGQNAGRIAWLTGVICLLVYLPALTCQFINLDDPYYITNNSLIKGLDRQQLVAIFTKPHLGGWLPLTYLSFAIDYLFWGLNPVGYHLTNIVLHAINAGLVVMLADRLSRPAQSAGAALGAHTQQYALMLLLAGLLFGMHPLRVESVAWVSERKDVLNGLFFLGSLLCYLSYVRHKEQGTGRATTAYIASFLLFIGSLLAKQVSVTLPAILLLLDWYPLGRCGRGRLAPVLLEKVPFLVVSGAVSLATILFAAQENQLMSISALPFSARVSVSGNALFEYVRLTLFPVGIIPYYLLPKSISAVYLSKTALIGGLTLIVFFVSRKRPVFGAAWLYAGIVMLPMLAFIHSGDDIAMAARYTYLPAIVPSIVAAGVIVTCGRKLAAVGAHALKYLLAGLVAIYLLFNLVTTVKLINVWQDTGTFWSRVIELQPVGRAYGDRGVYYLINGQPAAAEADFSAAITIAQGAGMATIYNLYAFRGVALGDLGRYEEAVRDFNQALALLPHPTYFQQRGLALKALGKEQEAAADFRRAGANPPAIDWF